MNSPSLGRAVAGLHLALFVGWTSAAATWAEPSSSLERFSESASTTADWTIAVYLDGDNDLEKFALIDLNEMELGIDGEVNVIVLVDRAEDYDTSDGDWKDARVYRIARDSNKGQVASSVIARVGEVNMGDPAVLQSFLTTTLQSFPAKRTALVLWNHGGGWAVHATDHGVPGQDHSTDHLTLPELSSAVRGALNAASLDAIDLIGFDMCLMAQLEVATELAPLGEVLVASQATEPGDGWPYDRLLSAFANPSNDTKAVARHIVDSFDAYYRERDESITTLAAYDLKKLPAFSMGLDSLLEDLDGEMDTIWPDISRSIFFAEGYAARSDLQRSQQALASVDLLDALRRMEQNAKNFPSSRLRTLEKAHSEFVLTSKTSQMRRLSNGVAVYAPVSRKVFNSDYEALSINSASRWPAFLKKLHALQAAQDEAPVIRDMQLVDWKAEESITEARPLNTHGVHYVVEGKNLLWLNGMKGEWDDKREGIYVYHRGAIVDANWSVRSRDTAADRMDLLIPKFTDGANELVTDTPGYRYAVTDGKDAFYATVDESGETGDHITVPILYHHPEVGDIGGTVYFHPQWWHAVAVELELVQEDGSIVFRQIKPEPQHEISLLFEYLRTDGQLSYARGSKIVWNDGPELLLGLDTPGDYVFGLVAETIGGKSTHALYEYKMTDDPELREFIKEGSNFDKDDLLGDWEMLEPEPFMSTGQMKPNGLLLEYKQHPEQETLLLSELTAPERNPNFADRNMVFLDTRMMNHTRSFKVETVGANEDPLGVEFSVSLINLYVKEQRPIMITRNTTSGLTYVFAKASSSTQQQTYGPSVGSDPGPNQPQPTQAKTLDGMWQRQDGVVLMIQDEQYALSQFGMAVDGGAFMIQGNILTSQSAYTGTVEQYEFSFQGNILQLRDAWGTVYVYQRMQ